MDGILVALQALARDVGHPGLTAFLVILRFLFESFDRDVKSGALAAEVLEVVAIGAEEPAGQASVRMLAPFAKLAGQRAGPATDPRGEAASMQPCFTRRSRT